mgnify:CR=1 FL=1
MSLARGRVTFIVRCHLPARSVSVLTRFKKGISRQSMPSGARYATGQLFVRCLVQLEVVFDLFFLELGGAMFWF